MFQPTQEQVDIINHPMSKHVVITDGIGTGKTMTMVRWIRHLVDDWKTAPNRIAAMKKAIRKLKHLKTV